MDMTCNDQYGDGNIIVHAHQEVHHEDFFLREGGRIFLSPAMRKNLRRMSPVWEPKYVHLPLAKWEAEQAISIEKYDIEIIEYEGTPLTGKFVLYPFDHFIRAIGKQNLIGAEVGVYEASHALGMLNHLPIKTLYLIDPYSSNEERVRNNPNQREGLDKAESIARPRLKPFSDRIVWVREKAVDIANMFADRSLDFIYFDGDKAYENTVMEQFLYESKVKIGGIIGGCDYANTYREGPVNEIKTANDEYIISRNISPFYHFPEWMQRWWINAA